jgi:hypothetical protein
MICLTLLTKGQTPFDWDIDGTRLVPKEDLCSEIQDRILALEEIAKDMADLNQFPQEVSEGSGRRSKLLGAPAFDPQQGVSIPIPQDIKDLVTASRQHKAKKSSLLPPTVWKGYKVPREE